MIANIVKCSSCLKPIKSGKMYYCCDPAEKICPTCSQKACSICKKLRSRTHTFGKCTKCRSWNTVDDCFFDVKFTQYFCPSCVISASKKTVSNYVLLDHVKYPKNQIQLFLQNYCRNCSQRINPSKCNEASKGEFLCLKCGGKKREKKQQCSLCLSEVMKSEIAIQEEGAIFCKICANASIFQEKQIENEQVNKKQKPMSESLVMDEKFQLADHQLQLIRDHEEALKAEKNKKQEQKKEQKKEEKKEQKKEEKKPQKESSEKKQLKQMDLEQKPLKRTASSKLIQNLQLNISEDLIDDLITCYLCGLQVDSIDSISGTHTENIMCRGCFTLQNNENIGFSSKIADQKMERRNLTVSKPIKKPQFSPQQKEKKINEGIPSLDKMLKTTDPKIGSSKINEKCIMCVYLKHPCSKHRV